MKILIAGGGNMGTTYAQAFINTHTVEKTKLYLLEHKPERVKELLELGFTNSFNEVGSWLTGIDLIILAVKPQDVQALYPKLLPYLNPQQTVLSIMAGVQMASISHALPIQKIVRAMPNLPASIGQGMTGFAATEAVSREELLAIQNLLNTTGKSIYFTNESQLNAVTAISGSGPAYVYYFMQSMIEGAETMGFSHQEAYLLVEQTFTGALALLKAHNLSCADWISRVASRGGTTEAAIQVFDDKAVSANIIAGVQAAETRSKELGELFGK